MGDKADGLPTKEVVACDNVANGVARSPIVIHPNTDVLLSIHTVAARNINLVQHYLQNCGLNHM